MTPDEIFRNDIMYDAEKIGDQVAEELEEEHNVSIQYLEVDTSGHSTVIYMNQRVGVNVIPQYRLSKGDRIISAVTLDSMEIPELNEPVTIELSDDSVRHWNNLNKLIAEYDKLSPIPFHNIKKDT